MRQGRRKDKTAAFVVSLLSMQQMFKGKGAQCRRCEHEKLFSEADCSQPA